MTTKQLQLAIEMHNTGAQWTTIANHFKTTTETLRRKLKRYEQIDN